MYKIDLIRLILLEEIVAFDESLYTHPNIFRIAIILPDNQPLIPLREGFAHNRDIHKESAVFFEGEVVAEGS